MSQSSSRITVGVETLAPPNGAAASPVFARPATPRDNRLRKIVEMIESDLSCTVQALAATVNLSPSHLQHLFKQQMGVCMSQLFTELRLQKGARLLAETDLSIKEVAYRIGYEHASSFVRAFQHRFQQTPGTYRRRAAESANTTAASVNSSPFHP